MTQSNGGIGLDKKMERRHALRYMEINITIDAAVENSQFTRYTYHDIAASDYDRMLSAYFHIVELEQLHHTFGCTRQKHGLAAFECQVTHVERGKTFWSVTMKQ